MRSASVVMHSMWSPCSRVGLLNEADAAARAFAAPSYDIPPPALAQRVQLSAAAPVDGSDGWQEPTGSSETLATAQIRWQRTGERRPGRPHPAGKVEEAAFHTCLLKFL
jgi:hypothetical protein